MDEQATIQPAVAEQPAQPQATTQTPPPDDPAAKLYSHLISAGATSDNIGDINAFKSALSDPDKASKLYDHLISSGATSDNIGDKNSFLSRFSAPHTTDGPVTTGQPIQNITGGNQGMPLSFVSDPKVKQHLQDQALLDDTHEQVQARVQQDQASAKLNEIYNSLPKSIQQKWATQVPSQPQGDIKPVSQDDQALYKAWNSPVGRVVGSISNVASSVSHAIVDIGQMGTFLYNHLNTNPASWLTDNASQGQKDFFDAANSAADLGLSKDVLDKAQNVPLLGMGTSLAPLALTEGIAGDVPTLAKSLFFLQFGGSGIRDLNDIEKSGVTIDPLVKNIFPLLSGAVGAVAMGNVGETLFGKLPAEAAGKLSSLISADVFMKAAQGDLSHETVAALLQGSTQTYLQKLEQGTLNIAQEWKDQIGNLAKFDIGNYASKAVSSGVSSADGYKDPFPENNLGSLSAQLFKTITQTAPIFAGLGFGAKEGLTLASPHTGFRDEITHSLINDPSDKNVANVKQQVQDYGSNEQIHGSSTWTPDQLQNTLETVDKIATAAKSIPKMVKPDVKEKMVGLLVGRKELEDQLSTYQEMNGSPDPAIQDVKTPEQQTYSNKVDQANDKLKAIVMGGPKAEVKYDLNESGTPIKTFPDGSSEKITQSRYDMERNESGASKSQMFKEDNPTFVNYAKSVGSTENNENSDGLVSKNSDAVHVELSPSKNEKTAYIKNISVPEESQGLGLAKDKLEQLGSKADEQNITLGAHLFDDQGYDKERLKSLYAGAGFEDKGGDYMERSPNKNNGKEETNAEGLIEEDSSGQKAVANEGQREEIKSKPTEASSDNVETSTSSGVKEPVDATLGSKEESAQPVGTENDRGTDVNGEGGQISSEGISSGRSGSDGYVRQFSDIRNNGNSPEQIARTANGETWYHGSGKDLSKERVDSSAFSKPDSLLGLGFYMTDDPSIAESYGSKRGKTGAGVVNEFHVNLNRVLDAEAPIDPKVLDLYKNNFQSIFGSKKESDEFFDDIIKDKPGASLIEVHRELAQYIAGENYSTGEVHEHFQDLEIGIKDDLGYDAISHVGGHTLGGKEHNVIIVLDPSGVYTENRSPFRDAGVYDPSKSVLSDQETSDLAKNAKSSQAKLDSVEKVISNHESGKKVLDEKDLENKKALRQKYSQQLTDIEAKIKASNESKFADVGKHDDNKNSSLDAPAVAYIDKKIADDKAELKKKGKPC